MQEIQWDYMRNTFWSQMGTAILWSGSMVLSCDIHPSILFIVMQLYPSKSAAAVSSGWYFVPWVHLDGVAREEAKDPRFCAKVIELVDRQVKEKLYRVCRMQVSVVQDVHLIL